jgi:beta-mannosidase
MKQFVLRLLIIVLCPMQIWSQNYERDLTSEKWNFEMGKMNDFKLYPAKVPGTIHTDLFQNKLISDPFFGANEKQLQWIEETDWSYTTTFTISKNEVHYENCFIQFDGLDTYAEVFLNGTKILSANNMFRTWKVDVKKLLKVGEHNLLYIHFTSAVKKGKEEAKKLSYTLPGDEKVFTRKAQYQYGWDWGPRFVTSGIYKKVSLQFWDTAKITNVKCNQNLKDKAELEFVTEIQSSKAGKFELKVNDKRKEIQLKKGLNKVVVNYEILKPKLWWPNGLGEAYLYSFQINLLQNNLLISKKEMKIGLRIIELVQEKDSLGKSFYFKVNGIPVFMKGANYIPPDSFLPRATDSVYKSIVKNAKDSNMNMLRVWGGGVYADDAFYDECDKNGILVWQDFMFACAMYPGDKAFLDNVKNEVIDNVNRMQNHPSIALWCGNNENDEGWHNWGWQKQYKYSVKDSTKIWNDYRTLFHEVIPQTLDSLLSKDKNRYWPSSPSIGWGKKESLTQGDSHYWGVWWGKEPFEVYEKKVGRFMSEYGFQGMPNIKTIKTFANEEDLNPQSESIKNHQKHPTGYETINEYMAREYVIPKKIEDYIYVSQLLQADGMKTAIEAHRRNKPYCMGTLFWQFNDCWPVTSWSSVDYYGRWKALNYQVKRSFEDLLISVNEEDSEYKVYLINDRMEKKYGGFVNELYDFSGNLLWKSVSAVIVPDNPNEVIHFELPKSDFNNFNLKKSVLLIRFESENETRKTLFYFAKPKDLQLTKPNIQIRKLDELTYEVASDVLAKNVYLSSEQETLFSDNYFDVLPNQKIEIKLSQPVQRIDVKSLFDTLN